MMIYVTQWIKVKTLTYKMYGLKKKNIAAAMGKRKG